MGCTTWLVSLAGDFHDIGTLDDQDIFPMDEEPSSFRSMQMNAFQWIWDFLVKGTHKVSGQDETG